MSEPTRYEYSNGNNYWGHFINPKTQHFAPYGEYVRWQDYARLKAEVERLEANTTKLCTHGDAEIARLKAEVERLTKAGDELHAFLINYIVDSRISSAYLNKLDDDWLAAKEGKQS
jgi:uncharacterized small protein (DUF1192 family)